MMNSAWNMFQPTKEQATMGRLSPASTASVAFSGNLIFILAPVSMFWGRLSRRSNDQTKNVQYAKSRWKVPREA
jgi:hypothetical protein